ncbi:hypothetical protein SAMN05216197_111103 [Pseudomonas graminis]|uniref:Uncharacterized protein n=1 Tax=Pseudomonas graminis TaxID=158627 RepID=A0A1I0DU40_9PSED|nr:hypothetical protein SAMN05216197_111103 [Pseudomonas graminis]
MHCSRYPVINQFARNLAKSLTDFAAAEPSNQSTNYSAAKNAQPTQGGYKHGDAKVGKRIGPCGWAG